jgi:hypothetical protein
MNRRDQYTLFLPFFDAEEKRYAALTQRATVFLGLISIISLFGGTKVANSQPRAIAFAISGFILLAVLCSLASLLIRSYRDICDVEQTVVTIEEEKYADEDVYSVLLAYMADAVKHNRDINDQRACWLQWSALFFALAIIMVAIASLTAQ